MPKISMKLIKKPIDGVTTHLIVRHQAIELLEIGPLAQNKEMHETYVEPWELAIDKPDFTIEFERYSEGGYAGLVYMEAPTAEDASLSVWQLLNRDWGDGMATNVRYMQVSEDWESKTKPGALTSGPGAGETEGLGKGWPGIESRHIADTIAEEMESGIDDTVKNIYDLAFEKAFRE